MRGLMIAAALAVCGTSGSAGLVTTNCSKWDGLRLTGTAKDFCECSIVGTPIEKLQCFDDALIRGLKLSQHHCTLEEEYGKLWCSWSSETLTKALRCRGIEPLGRLSCFESISKIEDLAYSQSLKKIRNIAATRLGRRALEQVQSEMTEQDR
ncbi:hypothetical protein [Tritonibacter mobilis]|uniref:hypothetical protein n=1 Tax=Tritonibacter mobilis TaxID=379347 RepID=UPI000806A52E|nr:hypothetical protein [Tritonibacter mobilis]